MTQFQPQKTRPVFDAAPRIVRVCFGLALCLAACACAAGSAESRHAAGGGILSELLLGFWHGLIGPVMLLVEVVNRFAPHVLPWTVRFYESDGTSAIYDIGFFFGLTGSPLLIASRWRRI